MSEKEQMMSEKLYRVQMNSKGAPNFSTAVEVADRPQGEWFKDDEGAFICSACGSGYKDQPTLMGKPMFKWCPLCGAKMKGADDDSKRD